jgi:hypothetical protein
MSEQDVAVVAIIGLVVLGLAALLLGGRIKVTRRTFEVDGERGKERKP